MLFRSTLISLSVALLCTATSEIWDDGDPRIAYFDLSWNNETCTTCSAKPPNPSDAYNSTWHDNTRIINNALNVTVPFTGIGITAYGILPGNKDGLPTYPSSNFTVYLDDVYAGEAIHIPTSPDYQFNVPLFSISGLEYGNHTFQMSMKNYSLLMIDYFNITTDLTPPSSSSSSSSSSSGISQGAIIGIAVGLFVLLLLCTAAIFHVRRLHFQREARKASAFKPPSSLERMHTQSGSAPSSPITFTSIQEEKDRQRVLDISPASVTTDRGAKSSVTDGKSSKNPVKHIDINIRCEVPPAPPPGAQVRNGTSRTSHVVTRKFLL